MDVGDGQVVHADHEGDALRDAPEDREGEIDLRSPRQRDGRHVVEGMRAPYRRPVLAMAHLAPLVVSAEAGRQRVQAGTGLLHEHEIRIVDVDEAGDVVDLRPGLVQQVPA